MYISGSSNITSWPILTRGGRLSAVQQIWLEFSNSQSLIRLVVCRCYEKQIIPFTWACVSKHVLYCTAVCNSAKQLASNMNSNQFSPLKGQ